VWTVVSSFRNLRELGRAALVAFATFPLLAWSTPRVQEGFADLPSGRSLYFSYKAPLNNSPTLVLLNGLDHDTESWRGVLRKIERSNEEVGILSYDMSGMGKTLQREILRSTISLKTFNGLPPIPYEEQTEDLEALIKSLNLHGEIILVGLSYGSAIAMDFLAKYPNMARSAVLASPYLAPLPQQDSVIRQEVRMVRQVPANPLNALTDDQLYDLFLIPMVSIYPIFEPILAQDPWKIPGVYRMVQGARSFSALATARRLRPGSVHVLWAARDQYLARDQVINFRRGARNTFASESILKDVHHNMVRQVPEYLAYFLLKIISDNQITNGERISVSPYEGYAQVGAQRWEFQADSKSLLDHIYLSTFETFFSPITWRLLEGNGDDCNNHLLEKY